MKTLSNLKMLRLGKFFFICYEPGCFWFRFFGGYGLAAKNIKYNWPVLFSERVGVRKPKKLFGWKWELLKPDCKTKR